ncbi:FG-GAP-like repeat-containing protein [Streptomyces sp. NBC_01257]|uniref:FG-GAP-like repeat-containing protein n=1 Tax=Streptomyces sp. NBC_01257 TaxID=2903799 RepID=UPI002DDADD33|nr:FG-GAP-like repeat-containing protein [Streptomyces sp. NBC_01257]WRZ66164.1 FG-GAP-like repeat-containing protein [Streptomyces sp. NBC_01257]
MRAVAPVAGGVSRVSLANGVLATRESNGSDEAFYRRMVTATPAGLTVGGPELLGHTDAAYVGPYPSGDGHVFELYRYEAGTTSVSSVGDEDDRRSLRMDADLDSVVEITGRYAVINGSNPVLQYIGDLGESPSIVVSRPVRAASVWGTTLWSATTAKGVLTAQDLKTRKITRTIDTGLPCVFKELQAVGRWVYWSCGPTGQAGVWDVTAGKNIGVPRGEALIGDGYLVQHDRSTGQLMLTGFQDGTANDTHAIGEVPDTAERGVTWTVDRFGGPVAYIAADQGVYLVSSGVARQPVAVVETEAGGSTGWANPWKATWLMSRPVGSWRIVIRNKATGTVVRTMDGLPNAGGVSGSATWNGRNDKGGYVPNGAYVWTLSAKPLDGKGPDASTSGTLKLTGGAAVPRDFVGRDGFGDLLVFTSNGDSAFRAGTGTGRVDSYEPGSMDWYGAKAVTEAVPFDDVSGDRCNDVLVRIPSGELRAYKPKCGGALYNTTAYTRVGGGWNVYDELTSPGDLTGDGRADLLAREKATGYLYLYESRGAGVFKARVKIGTGWKGYLLAGAGDVTGDGRGDLLARDAAGVLWRYAGTGKGTLAARVKVGGGWQVYNSLVGVGDMSGDGKADLLARDTSGVLWSYRGDGKGLFSARARVGGGWQTYSRLA